MSYPRTPWQISHYSLIFSVLSMTSGVSVCAGVYTSKSVKSVVTVTVIAFDDGLQASKM